MKVRGTTDVFDLKDADIDEHFKDAVNVVVQYDRASASLIQRRLGIGYARSARLIDQLEAAGVVGPAEGSTPREVLCRDPKELFGENWEKQPKKLHYEEEIWTPEPPKNYKMPIDVKLTQNENIPWSRQFSEIYKSPDLKEMEFPIPLGFDDQDRLKIESLLDVNNLIIAGNPLSQKENLVDTILLSNLLRYDPSQLKLILVDPTHYLDLYNGIPYLLSPVVNDHEKEISVFKWLFAECERRQKQFAEKGVRDIRAFNEQAGFVALPRILVATLADFYAEEVEDALFMLTAQGARTGIHNIVITNHASGSFLPATLKSNIPARVVFRLTSPGESRAIDVSGGEKLEPGELVYKPNYGSTLSLKGIFTPEVNVKEVVSAIKQSSGNA